MIRKLRTALLFALLLSLSGCGILVGYAMTAGAGVEEVKILSGSLADVKAGGRVVVVAPFAKEGSGYYLSRGDDAVWFADALNEGSFLKADVHFIEVYQTLDLEKKALREMESAKLAQGLGLAAPPDYLLFGTILHRDSVVAPMQGVIMEVGYRLAFYDTAAKKEVAVVEASARDLFAEAVPDIVAELEARAKKK